MGDVSSEPRKPISQYLSLFRTCLHTDRSNLHRRPSKSGGPPRESGPAVAAPDTGLPLALKVGGLDQGTPAVRRGRKARGLPPEIARSPKSPRGTRSHA